MRPHAGERMDLTLVVMAAGIGRRFGGDKQLEAVGPGGEAFLDYAIRDAAAAGIDDVVIIVRTDIEHAVADHLRAQQPALKPRFVRQDELGPPREKPWGTAHAILAVAQAVSGAFVVVNADDYYGPASYVRLAKAIGDARPDEALLVAFELGHTLPAEGEVTRGVCEVDGGRLARLVETSGLGRRADGAITAGAGGPAYPADTPVSMNMWGFPSRLLELLPGRWERWYAEHRAAEGDEFLLPAVAHELMRDGELSVRVVRTDERWVGVTNPDDLETARQALARRRD